MFRTNTKHLQIGLLDTVAHLSDRRRQRLEDSWAGEFYREITCRVDEALFAPLYADVPSRPNTPVNQLFGIEVLKNGYGWSDAELFEHLDFDLQVRYALGVRDLETEICDPRTIYNFRRRVSAYMQAQGVDVLNQAFEAWADAQCVALGLDTRQQRMDSTQLSSNIRTYSRLHLLVEGLQHAARMLSPADQERYAAQLQPYLQGPAGQYCYRLKPGSYAAELEQLGPRLAELLAAWATDYGDTDAYRLLQRVFQEHFTVATPETPTVITVKPPAELRASSLQAPDDPDATYRTKNGQGYRGYVANVTETCAPENPVQLITKLQVAPNTTDDETLLCAVVPDLRARLALETLHIDGGYNGPEASQTATNTGVTLVPTAIRGAQPNPDQVGLADFAWDTTVTEVAGQAVAVPTQVTCPQGHTIPVQSGRAAGRYGAEFPAADCEQCPLRERCPTQPLQQRPVQVLRVTLRQVAVAQARRTCAAPHNAGPPYLRPAVEATVRSLKHPFGDERGQLPVRGQPRVTMVVIASGVMLNLRRIWRYRQAERRKNQQHQPQTGASPERATLGARWHAALACWWGQMRRSCGLPTPAFMC
jgi:hypothetical protein